MGAVAEEVGNSLTYFCWELYVTTLCTTQGMDGLQNTVSRQQGAETLISINKMNSQCRYTTRQLHKIILLCIFHAKKYCRPSALGAAISWQIFRRVIYHRDGRSKSVMRCSVTSSGNTLYGCVNSVMQVSKGRCLGIQKLPKPEQAGWNNWNTAGGRSSAARVPGLRIYFCNCVEYSPFFKNHKLPAKEFY